MLGMQLPFLATLALICPVARLGAKRIIFDEGANGALELSKTVRGGTGWLPSEQHRCLVQWDLGKSGIASIAFPVHSCVVDCKPFGRNRYDKKFSEALIQKQHKGKCKCTTLDGEKVVHYIGNCTQKQKCFETYQRMRTDEVATSNGGSLTITHHPELYRTSAYKYVCQRDGCGKDECKKAEAVFPSLLVGRSREEKKTALGIVLKAQSKWKLRVDAGPQKVHALQDTHSETLKEQQPGDVIAGWVTDDRKEWTTLRGERGFVHQSDDWDEIEKGQLTAEEEQFFQGFSDMELQKITLGNFLERDTLDIVTTTVTTITTTVTTTLVTTTEVNMLPVAVETDARVSNDELTSSEDDLHTLELDNLETHTETSNRRRIDMQDMNISEDQLQSSECVDSPQWRNSNKYGCQGQKSYESKGWCKDGKVAKSWTTGKRWFYPERHCCVCGKGQADQATQELWTAEWVQRTTTTTTPRFFLHLLPSEPTEPGVLQELDLHIPSPSILFAKKGWGLLDQGVANLEFILKVVNTTLQTEIDKFGANAKTLACPHGASTSCHSTHDAEGCQSIERKLEGLPEWRANTVGKAIAARDPNFFVGKSSGHYKRENGTNFEGGRFATVLFKVYDATGVVPDCKAHDFYDFLDREETREAGRRNITMCDKQPCS